MKSDGLVLNYNMIHYFNYNFDIITSLGIIYFIILNNLFISYLLKPVLISNSFIGIGFLSYREAIFII
jgi:hypothetical protein